MYLFTSESVSPGHPDKVADIIADTIVDTILEHDKDSRVATEVLVAGENIIIGGEVKTDLDVNYEAIVKKALIGIGYKDDSAFSDAEVIKPKNVKVQAFVNKQSPDISQGVDQDGETGAGDQGIMFGFASNETTEYMPAAISYAKHLQQYIYELAKLDSDLGIDIKTQVSVDYGTKENFENCKPQKIHTIVVSVPCVSTLSIEDLRQKVKCMICLAGLPKELFSIDDCVLHINPTGRYVNHSPLHDSGITGRKLIVDSFGGYSPIGGGAQSSKDYTKVDRSGLYAARWLAKNLVAKGYAKKCIVQLSYAIGVAKPLSVNVDTLGTYASLNDDELSKMLDRFALTPKWITEKFHLDIRKGFTYADVAARGQVGEEDYPWEKIELDSF